MVKTLYGFYISCKFTASRHKNLASSFTRPLKKGIYALPGLSFNPKALKVQKFAKFQLSHFFRDKKRLVIWHDVVNNSLSRPRSNNNKPLTPSQLIEVLEKYQERIEAIVYCPREVTPNIYNQLKRSTLVTIHLVKDIVSRRKQKDLSLLKEYRALHQKPALELKTLTIVLAQKNNLRSLITRYRPKKLSKHRRKRSAPVMRSRRWNLLKPLVT